MSLYRKHLKRDSFVRFATTAAVFVLLLAVLLASAGHTQATQGYWHDARSLDAAELGVESLSGIAFDAAAGQFHVLGREAVALVNMAGDVVGGYRLGYPPGASVTFDHGALVLLDPVGQSLLEIQPPGIGDAPVALPTERLSAARLALRDARGIAAGEGGQLFVLDAARGQVFHIAPANGLPTQVGSTPLPSGEAAWRGLAYDLARRSLYTASGDGRLIYELSLDGSVLAVRDIAELRLGDVIALALAPSGDPTDDPATQSLYIASGGAGGRLTELALAGPPEFGVRPTALDATAFRTVKTSLWSPPSPDPTGLDYSAKLRRLLISDSEVEETPIFAGKNLFQASTGGALAASCGLTHYTNEPVGLAVNPANGAIFIADDNTDRVFEVRVGTDGKLCTSDDVVRSFSTRAFNSFDPEGAAFGKGMVFISDGEGAEVYAIHPGANGRFDGLPPAGDDRVQVSFDTAAVGLRDPEGIGYHAQRNSLFLVSRLERRVLVELSLTGALLNTFDISPLNAVFPAGVGIGPGSSGSGQSVYIVDRGVDNDEDPAENDGKLYEVSLGSVEPPPPDAGPLYISRAADGARVVGNLAQTADEDILYFDGNEWTLFFDGSDVLPANLDVDAFALLDNTTLLLSFAQAGKINGIGAVDDSDIVRFEAAALGPNTAGTFSLYFDGSDVGLTADGEDVDAISLLADGRLAVSTQGAYSVPGLSGRGEDLLLFTSDALGANTAGTWSLYFDGSDVGITPRMNIDGASLSGNKLYLTTANAFSGSGVSAADEDVFVCASAVFGPNSQCSYSLTLYFDGSAWKLGADDIDALFIP